MANVKLSVIIPAYNEAKNLKSGSLDEVYAYLRKQAYSYEVLIVDDGSTDNTAELIEELIKDKKNFKLVRNPHGGKAITVMSGMLKGEGEIVLFTDMDQATPLKEVEKFFLHFEEGVDIVIGSRSGRKGAPLIRKVSAFGFAVLRNIILGLPYSDTQCGFKAFNQKATRTIIPDLLKKWEKMKSSKAAVNAGIDIEMLFLARKRGLKVAEVVVDWHHVGSERVQIISDAVEAVKDMLRIRISDLQGKYN